MNIRSKSRTRAQAPSTSRRSGSDYRKLPKLKVTLKRNPQFRDFVYTDYKYLWAAYKLGLTDFPEGIDPKEFAAHVDNYVEMNYEYGWTMTEKNQPIGFVFGSVAGPLVLLRDMTWMPNASPRNKFEHIVNLLNTLRRQMKIIFYSTDKDKDYYVHIARHGIARRIGKLEDMGEPLTLWETRWQAR